MEEKVYSVSEVNLLIKELLEEVPTFRRLMIRGEISNYKVYPSGHHYFTLKDAEGALRCVMFKGNAVSLRFRPENGMQVIAEGRISVFPRDGAYQLYCTALTADGLGDLHVAFEQLKQKLYAQGLFAQEHKKPLPRYPGTIAIITSSAGAAVHDMMRILNRRFPMAKVVLLPVRVQGAEAPAEIAGALRYANRYHVADVIITGRGGGSIEDLWAFNEEVVAHAIYESEIPVISAVGHEPDVTISDYVADARASTPSNAAEIVVPDQQALRSWLADSQERLLQSEKKILQQRKQSLSTLQEKRVIRDPTAYIADKRLLLDYTQQRLSAAEKQRLFSWKQRFGSLAASLDALSPLKVLGRGYAVVRKENGEVLRSFRQTEIGETIDVTLSQGQLQCIVEQVKGEK